MLQLLLVLGFHSNVLVDKACSSSHGTMPCLHCSTCKQLEP
jgi:hypothetical protein